MSAKMAGCRPEHSASDKEYLLLHAAMDLLWTVLILPCLNILFASIFLCASVYNVTMQASLIYNLIAYDKHANNITIILIGPGF